MFRIQKTIPFPELDTKPPITALPELSEDLQQCLSLITAFDGTLRHLLRCSESGILYTTSPRTRRCWRYVAVGDNEVYNLPAQVCSECLVRAGPSNVDNIYVQVDYTATSTAAWPLSANEAVKVHPDNLRNIYILLAKTGDIVYYFPCE